MLHGDMKLNKDNKLLSSARRFLVATLSAALLPSLIVIQPAHADNSNDDVMGDGMGQSFGHTYKRGWEEQELALPSAPQNDNLISLKVFQMPRYKYFIDASSVNVTAGDNVVRYTVVIEPPSGLRSVLFEGIRCDNNEYKMYASALWGQPLNPLTSPQWKTIEESGTGAYRHDLFTYFLCENSIIKGKKEDILQLLEYPLDNFISEELE